MSKKQSGVPNVGPGNISMHKGKGGKAHTGHNHDESMVMHHGGNGHGGKDPHAHPSHHEANKEFGMHAGMSPKHVYGQLNEAADENDGDADMGGCCDGE